MMSEEIVNSVRFLINMLKVIEIFVIMFLAALNTITIIYQKCYIDFL